MLAVLPSTAREAALLGVGLAAGYCIARLLTRTATRCAVQPPKRCFKLAVAAEVEEFQKTGKICSTLDKTDGFVHLSVRQRN